MADEEKQEAEDEPKATEGEESSEEGGEDKPKKDRGPLKLLGGVIGLIAAGGVLAFMALPSKPGPPPRFTGPYHHSLFEAEFVSNVSDNNFTRFIKTNPYIEYFAYDQGYLTQRVTDPGYTALLHHVFGGLISDAKLDEIHSGVARDQFAEEIRIKIDPILFPVHIGRTKLPLEGDSESGVRPGNSYRQATFSGRFENHVLKIDALARTMQIDEGPLTSYAGDEEDLLVMDAAGERIYLDVTQMDEEFQGEIPLGRHGRIRQVFLNQLAQ